MAHLTKRARLFIEGGGTYTAAKEAGYGDPSRAMARLLKNPMVQDELEKRLRPELEAAGLTREKLEAKLVEIINADRSEVKDSDRLKAIELAAKLMGYFREAGAAPPMLFHFNMGAVPQPPAPNTISVPAQPAEISHDRV